ncbi:TIGR02679 family protein [Bradyrhizobium sp. Arg314]
MSDKADARLQRLLGGDHLASLRRRLRQRFERAPLDTVDHIRISELGAEEHAALASLLGLPQRRSKSLRIDVRSVDTALQHAGIAPSLRDALEKLDGPILHLAGTRLRMQAFWSGVIDGCGDPRLAGLLRTPTGIGLIKRLARQDPEAAAQLCRRAEEVLRHLPANGITRSQLAADVLGDAHALDNGRAAAALVLAVWRLATSPVANAGDDTQLELKDQLDGDLAGGAERVRDIWASAGVLVNELARPALFLNLPVRKAESNRWPAGEPAFASLRSLLRSPLPWDVADRKVYVCENPNLLAIAADRLGAGCAPLVCTDGMPAAAQRCLLSQLAQAEARLCYHGDFDWPGLRIGNHVVRSHGAQPWRFGAADYLAAVRQAPSPTHSLAGNPVEASWDGALTLAMQERRVAIAEEAVAASLLQDLDHR